MLDSLNFCQDVDSSQDCFPQSIYFCQAGTAERIRRISALSSWEGGFLETMTFGGDQAWLNEATAILDAVESWATFDLFKCKRGWAFDGGESTKDGFFPLDFFQKWRAQSLRRFYGNTPIEVSPELETEISKVRWELLQHPWFTLHNKSYYEHGKHAGWYNKESWEMIWATIWWASTRNEWAWIGDEQYIDSMVFLNEAWMKNIWARALKWENQGWVDNFIILTWDNYQDILNQTLYESWDIRSSIAYLWESSRISSLEKQWLEMFVSRKTNVNRWRNIHFLHELFRRINKEFYWWLREVKNVKQLWLYWRDFFTMSRESVPDNIKLHLLESVLHMKTLTKGGMAVTWSWNFVEGWYGEYGVWLRTWDNQQVNFMISEIHDMLDAVFKMGASQNVSIKMNPMKSSLSDGDVLEFSVIMAQIEHMVMSLESSLTRFFPVKNIITRGRKEREAFFQAILQ